MKRRQGDIKVKVIKKKGRRNLLLRWTDPRTGKPREQSATTSRRRDAEREAALLEEALANGALLEENGWREFCQRYEIEHMPSLSDQSAVAWGVVKRTVSDILKPDMLDQIDSQAVSKFAAELRRRGKAEQTIETYLARLRAALTWAKEQGLIASVPSFRRPSRAKGASKMARSRPVTGEEFERILDTVAKVRPGDAELWRQFIRGLWHSGFRLEELLQLSWDDDAEWTVETRHKPPMVRIRHTAEKAHSDRLQPITPDFWNLLCEIPEGQRSGPCFPIPGKSGQMTVKKVCNIISAIGRKAGVVTDPSSKKCATSHDIGRRAFAVRLGQILSLAELAVWMRHKSPQTTMNYYHNPPAKMLADRVWSEKGGVLGGVPKSPAINNSGE